MQFDLLPTNFDTVSEPGDESLGFAVIAAGVGANPGGRSLDRRTPCGPPALCAGHGQTCPYITAIPDEPQIIVRQHRPARFMTDTEWAWRTGHTPVSDW